jgi:hypothetical protein
MRTMKRRRWGNGAKGPQPERAAAPLTNLAFISLKTERERERRVKTAIIALALGLDYQASPSAIPVLRTGWNAW